MDCQRCGTPNAAGSRFCDHCGAPLTASCPSCGAANRPGARFCGSCGSVIGSPQPGVDAPTLSGPPTLTGGAAGSPTRTDPTSIDGALAPAARGYPGPTDRPGSRAAERRLVTVLFADLVGFTPFAEERDPEAVRELLTAYFDRTRLVVERHGGSVEKFIGDAVMAVWGSPVAREDDAERAVRAALEIVGTVRALGHGLDLGLDARVGVLTGEAAVDPAALGEGMVAGDLVNTAARLQSAAPAGTVLVGEPTMRAVGDAVAFVAAGDQILKGKSTPVPAWRALRVVADHGSGTTADLVESPFVGRDDELESLKDVLHATGRDRRTRLVSVTGVAGIGKSRLATELGRYVDGLVEPILWHRGRSPSYGEGITFWALGEMVRQRAGLAEGDDEPTTRAALHEMVLEYVPDEVDRDWVEPGVLTLLGLEPAPPGGREVLFAAWRILFERISERGTTVLLFEDLHWADPGLLDFIDHFLANARSVPVLVVTLARPELFERRPDWMLGRRNVTGIALEPLPEAAMRELLAEWVPGLPDPAVRAILARADGVPMYAVETIRSLVADGRLERTDGAYRPTGDLRELRVPETLRSLIASRLDGLDPVDRGLLQDGAVLGQTFSLSALAAITGLPDGEVEERLRGLARRELIRLDTDPRSPERGQYGFVQSLVREVAYATLSKRDRRARHLAVARHYATIDDPELAGALAGHYAAALEASTEGPEADALAVQARRALRAAAERAMSLGADDQAIAHLDRAISFTTGDQERAELLELAATAALRSARYETSITRAEAARSAFRAAGDGAGVLRAADLIGVAQIESSQLAEAQATLSLALAELETWPGPHPRDLRATLEARLSRVLMRLDDNLAAIEAADRALVVAEQDRLEAVVAEALTNKGSALANLGRWREGSALLEAAGHIAAQVGDVNRELRARGNLASTIWTEEPTRALAIQEENLEIARRIGLREQIVWTTMTIGYGEYFAARDWDRALALVDAALDDELSPSDRARLLGVQVTIAIDRGLIDEALVREVEALFEAQSDPEALTATDSIEGQIAAVDGRLVDAFERYERAAAGGHQNDFANGAEAAYVALWLGDAVRARTVLASLDSISDTTKLAEATRGWVRAGIAALDGRIPEAQVGFRESIRALDEAWWAARTAMTAVMLLPPSAETRAWADAAREVFERCRARPYLAMLERAEARLSSIEGAGRPVDLARPSTREIGTSS